MLTELLATVGEVFVCSRKSLARVLKVLAISTMFAFASFKVKESVGQVLYKKKTGRQQRKVSDGVRSVSDGIRWVSNGVGKLLYCVRKVFDGVTQVS